MGRTCRSFAAVLAGLALVAMLPAPCPCPEEAAAPRSGHECCAPPVGVAAADGGCCNEAPASAEAVPSSEVAASAPVAVSGLSAATTAGPAEPPRPSIAPAASPPPTVLRI
jgi:hypothetical protein